MTDYQPIKINMTATARKSTKVSAVFLLGVLFAFGSPLCHGQGVIDGKPTDPVFQPSEPVQKSSAPTLSVWQSNYEKVNAALPKGSDVAFHETAVASKPGDGLGGAAPMIAPEPSTFVLMAAGSAALLRYGWRRRSR